MDIYNEMINELESMYEVKGIVPQIGGGSDCITLEDIYPTNKSSESQKDTKKIVSLLEEISKKLDSKKVDLKYEVKSKPSKPTPTVSFNHIVVSSKEESGLTRKYFDELVSHVQGLKLVYGDSIDVKYISKDEIVIGAISIKFVEGKK